LAGVLCAPFEPRDVQLVLIVAAAAWAFTIHQAMMMDAMEAAMWRDMNMSMNGMEPSWTQLDVLLLLVMCRQ
jgi:hypothetical protein